MKSISSQTRALLDELTKRVSSLSRGTECNSSCAEVIHSIAETGDPKAVPYLLGIVIKGPEETAKEAARAIHSLMADIEVTPLLRLDSAIRAHSGCIYGPASQLEYYVLDQSCLEKFIGFHEESTTLLGLASFAADGFTREAAIRILAQRQHGEELPFLLIRLNDWVNEVQNVAQKATDERLVAAYAALFARNLPLVMRLSGCHRKKHSIFIDGVRRLLKEEKCRDQLLEGIKDSRAMVRRHCVELLFEIESIDVLPWMKVVARDRDPFVRLTAIWTVLKKRRDVEARAVFELFKNDKFARIRNVIYDELVQELGFEETEPELRVALFDKNRSLREMARFYLEKNSDKEVEFSQIYKTTIRDLKNDLPIGAILGLAETGADLDDTVLLPLTEHHRISIRRAAVCGLSRIGGEKHFELFRELALQESPGVAREACDALLPHAHLYGDNRLWDDFSDSGDPLVRSRLLKIIAKLSKWNRLPLLLKVALHGTLEEAEKSLGLLTRWLFEYNRSFAAPSQSQLAEIEKLLPQVEERLGKSALFNELRFCLTGK